MNHFCCRENDEFVYFIYLLNCFVSLNFHSDHQCFKNRIDEPEKLSVHNSVVESVMS